MAERITSPQNPYLQHVKKLRAVRKYRYANRAFLADGSKLVEEAIRWGLTPEAILTREGVPFPVPEGVRHIIISDRLMKDVSRMDTPQGVMAVCPMPEQRAPELVPGCLILDGIQDPGNMGTLIRTAVAAGYKAIIAMSGTVDIYSPKVLRATAGMIFEIPVIYVTGEDRLRDILRRSGRRIAVTAVDGGVPYYEEDLSRGIALIIGNEGSGVSDAMIEMADVKVTLPMRGRIESLNAAVAAAILMYEAVRGR